MQPAAGGLESTGLEDYVEQVISWCLNLPQPIVLIGASLGGILALKAAHRVAPDGMVLVNSVPPAGFGGLKPFEVDAVVRWSNSSFNETLAAMPDCSLESAKFAHERWRDESGAVIRAARIGVPVPKPTCPRLAVVSELDEDIPVATLLEVQQWLEADLDYCSGASHVGPLLGKEAEMVGQRVAAWLECI